MIEFSEAIQIVRSNFIDPGCERTPLHLSAGRYLAEEIKADRDTPPFNKSAVDGFACRAEDLSNQLKIIETIQAGHMPAKSVSRGECSRIMTGAMVPYGADAVVMVEECIVDGDIMHYLGRGVKDNICKKGEDIRMGEVAISTGVLINSAHIAVMASMGVVEPLVKKALKVGILSTGDEIVEPRESPTTVQIRNSNGWQLYSQAIMAGTDAAYLGIIKDNPETTIQIIRDGIEKCDALILTGGVSMGDFDYVPQSLTILGFDILFDRVAVQPGKPSTFAILRDESGSVAKVVFALPGNPVSSYLQFEILVKSWIASSSGAEDPVARIQLPLAQEYVRKNNSREALIPGVVKENGVFEPLSYNGSAHILAMGRANAVAVIPIGISQLAAGSPVGVILLR